jgi:hypothetical protein
MTLKEAAEKGIARLRLPHWAFSNAYVRQDLMPDGHGGWLVGPWLNLFSPDEQKAIGVETPQATLRLGEIDNHEFVEYTGPLAPQDAPRDIGRKE